jgi:hypothetical protein
MTLPPALWGVVALGALAVVTIVSNRRRQAARLAAMRARWGQATDRTRDMAAISRYHLAAIDRHASADVIDDRTWADLDMDDVFARLDCTESAVGQQVLYARLRTAPIGNHLEAFEALTTRLQEEFKTRETAQAALARLSDPAAYDLIDLAAPGTFETKVWYVLFPILAAAMAVAVVALPFYPAAVFLLALGSVVSLTIRGVVAPSLRIVARAFRQVGPLLAAADGIATLNQADVAPLLGRLQSDVRELSQLRRVASWAGRDATGAASGDIAGVLFEYLNIVFCLDANAYFFGARELRRRSQNLLNVITAVGEADAALAIASYRASATGWTRPTLRPTGAPLRLVGVRHPLLLNAVPNSITLGPPHGVIVTGSNMSGKSTFLRTVGVTAILAQTIHTCLAEEYDGPVFVVRTCIGRSDDLASGKSYYLVEVESVLSLVHAARQPAAHLMLFDELFRGTNAVERIAAGEAVLATLIARGPNGLPTPHVVIAATHDRELVDLLAGSYAAYHFTDRMDAEGLTFDYTLQPGAATTRNAIALLELRGAPTDLVAHALERARMLDEARATLPLK